MKLNFNFEIETEQSAETFINETLDSCEQIKSMNHDEEFGISVCALLILAQAKSSQQKSKEIAMNGLKRLEHFMLLRGYNGFKDSGLFESSLFLLVRINKILNKNKSTSRSIFELILQNIELLELILNSDLDGCLIRDFAEIVINRCSFSLGDISSLTLMIMNCYLIRNSSLIQFGDFGNNLLWEWHLKSTQNSIIATREEILNDVVAFNYDNQYDEKVTYYNKYPIHLFNESLAIQTRIQTRVKVYADILKQFHHLVHSDAIASEKIQSMFSDIERFGKAMNVKRNEKMRNPNNSSNSDFLLSVKHILDSEMRKSPFFRFKKTSLKPKINQSQSLSLSKLTSKAFSFVENMFTSSKRSEIQISIPGEINHSETSSKKFEHKVFAILTISKILSERLENEINSKSYFSPLMTLVADNLSHPSFVISLKLSQLSAIIFKSAENDNERVNAILELFIHSMSDIKNIETLAMIISMAVLNLSESWLSNLKIIIINIFMKILRMNMKLGKQTLAVTSYLALKKNSETFKSIFESLLIIIQSDILSNKTNDLFYNKIMTKTIDSYSSNLSNTKFILTLFNNQEKLSNNKHINFFSAKDFIIDPALIFEELIPTVDQDKRFNGLWRLFSKIKFIENLTFESSQFELSIENIKSLSNYYRILSLELFFHKSSLFSKLLSRKLMQTAISMVCNAKLSLKDIISQINEFTGRRMEVIHGPMAYILNFSEKTVAKYFLILCAYSFKRVHLSSLMRDEVLALAKDLFEMIVAYFNCESHNIIFSRKQIYTMVKLFLIKFENFDEKGGHCESMPEYHLSLYYCIQMEALLRNELKNKKTKGKEFQWLLECLAMIFKYTFKSDLMLVKGCNKLLVEGNYKKLCDHIKTQSGPNSSRELVVSFMENLRRRNSQDFFELHYLFGYIADVMCYFKEKSPDSDLVAVIGPFFNKAVNCDIFKDFLVIYERLVSNIEEYKAITLQLGEEFVQYFISKATVALYNESFKTQFSSLWSIEMAFRLIFPFPTKLLITSDQFLEVNHHSIVDSTESPEFFSSKIRYLQLLLSTSKVRQSNSEISFVMIAITYYLNLMDPHPVAAKDEIISQEPNSRSIHPFDILNKRELKIILPIAIDIFYTLTSTYCDTWFSISQVSQFISHPIIKSAPEYTRLICNMIGIIDRCKLISNEQRIYFVIDLIGYFCQAIILKPEENQSPIAKDDVSALFQTLMSMNVGIINNRSEFYVKRVLSLFKLIAKNYDDALQKNQVEACSILFIILVFTVDWLKEASVESVSLLSASLLSARVSGISENVSSEVLKQYSQVLPSASQQSFRVTLVPILYALDKKENSIQFKNLKPIFIILMDSMIKAKQFELAAKLVNIVWYKEEKEITKSCLSKLIEMNSISIIENIDFRNQDILEELKSLGESEKKLARFKQVKPEEGKAAKPVLMKLGAIKNLKKIEK